MQIWAGRQVNGRWSVFNYVAGAEELLAPDTALMEHGEGDDGLDNAQTLVVIVMVRRMVIVMVL
jgi:hypothetical protein